VLFASPIALRAH